MSLAEITAPGDKGELGVRLATLIISLVLMVGLFVQSLLASAGGALIEDKGVEESGAVGILVALGFLLGAAFVMALPRVSVAVFALSGVIAFMGSGSFPDLVIWGVVSLVLALMSWFGYREKRGKRAPDTSVAQM